MKLPSFVDERFLEHRLRSSSWAGMAAAATAGGLFLYRHFHDGRWNYDLFAVLAVMVLVKFCALAWHRFHR
jgi:hypothetical protein